MGVMCYKLSRDGASGKITTDEMTADMRPHIWPATPSLAATSSLHRLRGAGTDLWFLLFFDLFLEDSDQSSDLQLRLLSASTSNVTGNKRKAAEIFRGMHLTSKLSHPI